MYRYNDYLHDLNDLKKLSTAKLVVGEYGLSVQGRDLYYIKIGDAKKAIIIQASIHAREYATIDIAMRWVKELINHNTSCLEFCFYFLPCTNPDGVVLAEQGEVWTEYKANANMVDLNTNFNARWGSGLHNKTQPSDSDYIGKYPLDQPESRALADFTLKINPVSTMSLHSRGREIYWDFFADKIRALRDEQIANIIAQHIGYCVVSSQNTSSGGYKDWCIQELKIPSFTIEMFDSNAQYPLSDELVDYEYNIVKSLPYVYMQALMCCLQ